MERANRFLTDSADLSYLPVGPGTPIVEIYCHFNTYGRHFSDESTLWEHLPLKEVYAFVPSFFEHRSWPAYRNHWTFFLVFPF